MKAVSVLESDEVMVVLTTSPAGLGHIRVMAALRHGVSAKTRLEELGMSDAFMQGIHRISSRSRSLRRVMEFFQTDPLAERQFITWYTGELRKRTDESFHLLYDLIQRRRPKPKVVVVLCTHFGMAHKLAQIRHKIEEETQVKIVLAVVVTDDSPQRVWAVWGVDYIFVPSGTTKSVLSTIISQMGKPLPEITILPYAVSPFLGQRLPSDLYQMRVDQVQPGSAGELNILVPISGAAVQLSYFKELIQCLSLKEETRVTVVSRDSKHTHEFLEWCQNQVRVEVYASGDDKEVVSVYEREYALNTFSIEVTKPSEQAFKALLTPKQRGGVLLMFSEPVGRQEYDNVAFLRRHHLLPTLEDQSVLDHLFLTGSSAAVTADFLKRAQSWRGVLLPKRGIEAGLAIGRLQQQGVLAAMMQFKGYLKGHEELDDDGVEKIWGVLEEKVEGLLKLS